MGLMVETVIRENLNPSGVILLKQYLDFINVFDKTQTDILL